MVVIHLSFLFTLVLLLFDFEIWSMVSVRWRWVNIDKGWMLFFMLLIFHGGSLCCLWRFVHCVFSCFHGKVTRGSMYMLVRDIRGEKMVWIRSNIMVEMNKNFADCCCWGGGRKHVREGECWLYCFVFFHVLCDMSVCIGLWEICPIYSEKN